MKKYAQRNFWLGDLVDGGKITNRENLNRVAKQTKRDPEDLYRLPEIAPDVLYLWRHYCHVKGQDPLTFAELRAWVELTGNILSPWEVDVLFDLDSAYYAPR